MDILERAFVEIIDGFVMLKDSSKGFEKLMPNGYCCALFMLTNEEDTYAEMVYVWTKDIRLDESYSEFCHRMANKLKTWMGTLTV